MPVQYAVLRSSTLPYVSAATDASYSGVFDSEGVFFLGAQLNEADMKTLRAGGRLGNRTVTISITGFTIDGVAKDPIIITVNISDFTDTAGRVFFGDRPLNDPGYTAFKLKGSVGTAAGSLNDTLDVYRVEQRLAYLGFPAMGASDAGGAPSFVHNVIQDFKVDGIWNRSESLAAILFSDVVTYSPGNRQLASPGGRANPGTYADTPTHRTAFYSTLYATADSFSISRDGTFN
jgi:hypothetical protein